MMSLPSARGGCYRVDDIAGSRVELAGVATPDDPLTPGIVVLGHEHMALTFTVEQARKLIVRLLLCIDDATGRDHNA